MRRPRLRITGIIAVGLVFTLVSMAWAGAGPAGETPCCQVTNPGAGALALKGTIAIVYDAANDFNLDVTLRLERGKTVRFFRLNLQGDGANLLGKTDSEIACLIFNPFELPDVPENALIRSRVFTFVDNILRAFFAGVTPYNTRLVITAGSTSGMQGVLECEDPNGPDYNVLLCEIPETQRTSSIGDIVIYAIDADRIRLENPMCF